MEHTIQLFPIKTVVTSNIDFLCLFYPGRNQAGTHLYEADIVSCTAAKPQMNKNCI